MDCHQVSINVEGSDGGPDPLISAIGGTIGAILGFIVGIIVTKCFLMDILRSKIGRRKEKNEHLTLHTIERQESPIIPDKKAKSVKSRFFKTKAKNPVNKEEKDEGLEPERFVPPAILTKPFASGLVDIVMGHQLELKFHELNKQENVDLYLNHISIWEHRHTCVLQMCTIILTQYFNQEKLTETDYSNILGKVQKAFAKSLLNFQMKISEEIGNSIEKKTESYTKLYSESSEAAYFMIENFHNTLAAFEADLRELVGDKDSDTLHLGLVKTIHNMEQNIETLNNFQRKELSNFNDLRFVVMQAFQSGSLAQIQSVRVRRSNGETILQRLSKSGRLSADDSGQLWRNYRESIDGNLDQVDRDMAEALGILQLQMVEQRKQAFADVNDKTTQDLQRVLDKSRAIKMRQFVESYFGALVEGKRQEHAARQQALKVEAQQLARLQEKAKQTLSARCDETIDTLMTSLVQGGALSDDDAHQVRRELSIKIEKIEGGYAGITQAQNQLIGRETKRAASLMRNETDDAARERSVVIGREIAKLLLGSQHHLAENDCSDILFEYDVTLLLLRNEADVIGGQAARALDLILLQRQVKLFESAHAKQQLTNREDLERVVTMLTESRSQHQLECNELYRQVGPLLLDGWVKKQIKLVCELAAKREVKNLSESGKQLRKSRAVTDNLKSEITTAAKTATAEETDITKLEETATKHRRKVDERNASLRQEHDMKMQIYKERLNSAHQVQMMQLQNREAKLLNSRPQSAGGDFSLSEVLDRLSQQVRNQRLIEIMEREHESDLATRINTQREGFVDALEFEFQELDKPLIAKFAKAFGMNKNQFQQLLQESLQSASMSKNQSAAWTNQLTRLWPKRTPGAKGRIGGDEEPEFPPIRPKSRRGLASSEQDDYSEFERVPSRGRKGKSFLKRVSRPQA